MKKQNPLHRWHVTPEEKATIRELTLGGVRQSEIARRLKITRQTVSRAQVAMGLPTHTLTPEAEIMLLFREGWPGCKISKHLKVPANRVWAVMHKNNFQRADRLGIKTPDENLARFVEALKNREGYIKTLAKRYGVGFCKARRLAHEVLQCSEFRPGASKPPLSSNFPQEYFSKTRGPDLTAELVSKIHWEVFGGQFPQDATPAQIAKGIVETASRFENASEAVKAEFFNRLLPHVAAQMQRAAEGAKWVM